MEAKHTPGPWDASGLTVYDTCMDGVASCHSAADARLIAAAPDLLEALRELHRHTTLYPTGGVGWNAVLDVAEAAIAKATGS